MEKIRDLATDISCKVWTANHVVVKTRDDMETRSRIQSDACKDCNRMLSMVQIARRRYHLKMQKYEAWVKQILAVRDKIKAWRDADRKRYLSMLKDVQ